MRGSKRLRVQGIKEVEQESLGVEQEEEEEEVSVVDMLFAVDVVHFLFVKG